MSGLQIGIWWIRLGSSYGLQLKAPWCPKLYAERNGLHRYLPLGGGWRIRVLTPIARRSL